jgi:thiopeptide-type bacteriocin biosynthesis protein
LFSCHFSLKKEEDRKRIVFAKPKALRKKLQPGEQCLALHLDCHPLDSDLKVIQVAKILSTFSKSGRIRGWYFLRFQRPNYHIRFRIFPKADDVAAIAGDLTKELLKNVKCDGISVEPFELEFDHYKDDLGIQLYQELSFEHTYKTVEYLKSRRGKAYSELEEGFDFLLITIHGFLRHLPISKRIQLLERLIPFESAKSMWKEDWAQFLEATRSAARQWTENALDRESQRMKSSMGYLPISKIESILSRYIHLAIFRVRVLPSFKFEALVVDSMIRIYRKDLALKKQSAKSVVKGNSKKFLEL